MNKPFREKLIEYYSTKELSPNQLERLNDLQSKGKWSSYIKPGLVGAIASAVLILFLYQGNTSFPDGVFKEVAKNHLKAMPSEVLSSDYSILNEAMDKLDFKIASSDYINKNFEIVGARYCSVQGKIAAQIRLKAINSKSIYTLYQYLPRSVREVEEKKSLIDGVETKIWKEDEIIFVLAGPKV